MKISPSNLGLWPRCLFEFITVFFFFLSMPAFYYANTAPDKNSLGHRSDGFHLVEVGNTGGSGLVGMCGSRQPNIIDKRQREIKSFL